MSEIPPSSYPVSHVSLRPFFLLQTLSRHLPCMHFALLFAFPRELVSCSFSDVGLDAAAARASASFLLDLAERQPDCVLPQMGLIVRVLEGKVWLFG